KSEEGGITDLQQRTHAWLQSLLDIQKQTGDSAEFLEHVKVDLFPDSVYVFTPKSKIIALPRGATALDFAYTIHTDIGDQTIAAKINHEQAALRTELRNGDIIEIITSPTSRPSPNWLTFVRTGKARSAIRHHLRTINLVESTDLGKRLLAQAMVALQLDPEMSSDVAERLMNESSAKSLEELYADIGVGKRMAALVARHVLGLVEGDVPRQEALLELTGETKLNKLDPVIIYGSEGVAVQLAQCCLPIPGDDIVGQLKRDQGITVHVVDCEVARRQRNKEPDRWIDVVWGSDLNRRFDCRIMLLLKNERGVLARVAAEIGESDANITFVGMEDDKDQLLTQLRFTVQVEDRIHLARLMRNVRRIPGVTRLLRERN
ncbi:MAG TPA: TGS domain-containing protein, partial [Burkholderiaceae bacterium]|nr:TGS domain-containing protein [Burkholderiaceae bacterium]